MSVFSEYILEARTISPLLVEAIFMNSPTCRSIFLSQKSTPVTFSVILRHGQSSKQFESSSNLELDEVTLCLSALGVGL